MGPNIFEFYGFPIRYYSLMYILALVIGIQIAKYHAKKYNINPKIIEDGGTWLIFSGILGARLYYIIAEWDYYKHNYMEIISIWKGIRGLAIHGGILGSMVGLIIFARKHNISVWRLFDLAAAPTLLGQAIGRIGNLMNGEAHGVPTFTPLSVIIKGNFNRWWLEHSNSLNHNFKELVPWGIVFPKGSPAGDQFPNMPLHPTMIYESILNTIGFFLLFFYFRKKNYPSGYLGAIYIIMYAIIRGIVTLFRADDLHLFGLRLPILFNIIFILIGLVVMYIRKDKKERI